LAEGQPKFILRQIVHKYLPESLMNREKRGFTIPVHDWLNGALKPLVEKYLSEKYIKDQNIFNPGYVQSIKHSFYVLKSENTYKIWFLLMFQMWYDKWMLGN
jgi:asparagine synthase (glutamine-hydrolysing)